MLQSGVQNEVGANKVFTFLKNSCRNRRAKQGACRSRSQMVVQPQPRAMFLYFLGFGLPISLLNDNLPYFIPFQNKKKLTIFYIIILR